VSIRRFKQVLRVFDGSFEHARRMRRSLREIMDLCGAARNCDIAPEVLKAAGVPANHALKKRLKQRRARAGRNLAKLLHRWHVHSHMRRWRGWLKAPPGDARPAVPLSRLSREFLDAGRAAAKAETSLKQMHKFRLLVKRFRYTLEILEASGNPPIDVLRDLQDRLGAINDCATTAELLDDMGVSASEKRRIKTAINRLIAHRTADFRVYWRKAHRHK